MFNNMFLYITKNTKVGSHEFSQNPKNCYREFAMISGHGTDTLLSMGFEIQGLGDLGDFSD